MPGPFHFSMAGYAGGMTMQQAQTLQARWTLLCERLGLPAAARQWRFLLGCYTEPSRAYHNLDHVADCLRLLDAIARHGRLAERFLHDLELALWFHDVIYDARRKDNEARSAVVFAQRVGRALPTARHRRVVQLILATRHVHPPKSIGETLIVDIDLAILAAPKAIFDSYERAIRKEYAFVSEKSFRAGRAAVLKRFLARRRIYGSAYGKAKFERKARRNLKHSLRYLTQRSA